MTDLQLQYTPTYIDVLSDGWSSLQAQATGDGREYEQLSVVSPGVLPPKETLDARMIAMTIDRVWTAIKAERNLRTQFGGSRVGSNWFHSDQASRTQQIALVILGVAGIPPGLMWKTMSGAFVNMTPTLAQQVFGAAISLDQAVFKAAEIHKERMASSSTPWSYDFSLGWPLMFEQFAAGITVAP